MKGALLSFIDPNLFISVQPKGSCQFIGHDYPDDHLILARRMGLCKVPLKPIPHRTIQFLAVSDHAQTTMLKTRSRAIALALAGIVLPGLHKFYLKQRGWGIAYLLLYPTHIPQFASVLEGVWYAWLGQNRFEQRFNPAIARLQSAPYAPLNTLTDIQLAARLDLAIDVNRATPKDWQRLPQLSSTQAQLLVQLTQAGVQFNSLDDMAAALGMAVNQLQPLAPVLKFYYYESPEEPARVNSETAADDSDGELPVNPNDASLPELMMIPDMEEAIAQRIVEQRQVTPYKDLVDFKERLALSAERIASLMYYVRF